ncbi:hypothetical protein ACFWMR_11750 [Amycolatopsis thailandensis]|uniref:Uncharacterized protein n=1 Tax=Amycolatopsis thailandensis TaxID=589330 RepID=A0A229SDV3_9PSEU|nr:hypothetical protein [Amycolatopsis thailandensis]OXM56951.1 hypothetical protein CFP71_10785 [Amycolatopsis thailandensis]
MTSAERDPVRRVGRWVSVRLQHRDVRIQSDTAEESVSYAGIVITSFENGVEVGERWIPLGGDPSEADDEQLIQQLRDALIWQARRPPTAAGE